MTVPAMLLDTVSRQQYRSMVNLYGPTFLSSSDRPNNNNNRKKTAIRTSTVPGTMMKSSLRVENMEPPPNPGTLLNDKQLKDQVDLVRNDGA
jgi:hypothetical protein